MTGVVIWWRKLQSRHAMHRRKMASTGSTVLAPTLRRSDSSRASCSRVRCLARSMTSFEGSPCRAVVRNVTIVPARIATTMRMMTIAVDIAKAKQASCLMQIESFAAAARQPWRSRRSWRAPASLARFMLRQWHENQSIPVLLAIGALMLATVVFAELGPAISLLRAKVAVVDTPSTDEAKHPDTRVALLDREPAESHGARRTLEN